MVLITRNNQQFIDKPSAARNFCTHKDHWIVNKIYQTIAILQTGLMILLQFVQLRKSFHFVDFFRPFCILGTFNI